MKIQIEFNPTTSHVMFQLDREFKDMFKIGLEQALRFLSLPATSMIAQSVSDTCHEDMLEGLTGLNKLGMFPAETIFLNHSEMDRAFRLLSVTVLDAISSQTDDVSRTVLACWETIASCLPCELPSRILPPVVELGWDFENDHLACYEWLRAQSGAPSTYLPMAKALRLLNFLQSCDCHQVLDGLMDDLAVVTEPLCKTAEAIMRRIAAKYPGPESEE